MPKRTSRFSKRKTSLKSSVAPLAYSQPGVYVEEVSSLPRTIEGVPTSTTAFVGKATSGPFNEPTTLRSFGEFETEFGGLSLDSFLGYSVMQFFENGGTRAIVVRLGTNSKNATVYFPRIHQSDPLRANQISTFAPSGAMAGIYARIDEARGVWKAPTGLQANLTGVSGFDIAISSTENRRLS